MQRRLADLNFNRQSDWRKGDVDLPVNFAERSDYELLDVYVTGVPDVMYPWHMDDVMQIRRYYDPDFVPLFRKFVYRTPSGTIVSFPHHGVGRYDERRQPDPRLERCLMPYGVRWRKPNVIDLWFEPAKKDRFAARHGLPAPYVPWGDWIVRMAEEARILSAREMKRAAQAAAENNEGAKARKDAQEEASYTAREEAPKLKDAVESLSSSDFAEIRARAEGWAPKPEPKPFVHLSQ